jgi:hypothetical protein
MLRFESPTWVVLCCALAQLACDRPPSEPAPSGSPATSAPTPAPTRDANTDAASTVASEPRTSSESDACAWLPESAVRSYASLAPDERVTREPSDLAGLRACRYRWRKRDARAIDARNADRALRDPRALAAFAGRSPAGVARMESSDAELRLSVFPPRSGTSAMLSRGFEMAHAGEQAVPSLGDQATYNAERRVLAVRKANRTFEVLSRTTDDPEASMTLAVQVARDVLARM